LASGKWQVASGKCNPSITQVQQPTPPAPRPLDRIDTVFDHEREGQLKLFELGCREKRLLAYPGQHSDDGPEAFEFAAAFLQRYLQ
jgi:hypothetical protein